GAQAEHDAQAVAAHEPDAAVEPASAPQGIEPSWRAHSQATPESSDEPPYAPPAADPDLPPAQPAPPADLDLAPAELQAPADQRPATDSYAAPADVYPQSADPAQPPAEPDVSRDIEAGSLHQEPEPAPSYPSAPAPSPQVTPTPTAPRRASQPPPPPPPPPPFGSAPRRLRSRRSPIARLAALAALALVVAAVVLLVRSLSGSGHTATVSKPAPVRVLIPEGKTRVQIAQIASAAGLTGSYRSATRRSALLDPAHYGAPSSTPDLEGFLFPATYDMTSGAPVGRLVDEQLAAFNEHFGPAEIQRARALHITPYQLLTVASMIEREAEIAGDRAKIAAVIYNRLHRGMPLGVDATIYYAVELRDGIATYTRELSESQLHIDSPYNTRTRPGLPPTPISNPGVASIQAAAHPAHAPYLYYVAAADGCGEHVFSTTLADFEANAAAYQAAVKRNGGRPPTCKKK
ncbi:MAG: aminodeoxychorismate lyase, partial [Solirubrobacterales bacterium]|nr:aminodeoxychorismate lyase [Solirubrobacterales bacterium]